MNVLKRLGCALGAAVGAGIVMGGLSRALMRAASLVTGGEPGFSWSGSFFIVLIYAIAMVPVALFAAFTTRWWRWIAGAAGSLFLAMPAVGVTTEELGATVGWTAAQWVAVVVVTIAIFGTIALAPIAAVRLVDALLGRRTAARPQPALAS